MGMLDLGFWRCCWGGPDVIAAAPLCPTARRLRSAWAEHLDDSSKGGRTGTGLGESPPGDLSSSAFILGDFGFISIFTVIEPP